MPRLDRCIAAAVLALAAAGCGSAGVAAVRPGPDPGGGHPGPGPALSSGPGAGSGFQVADSNNNVYKITLEKVVDPAQGTDIYKPPDPGTRYVDTVFRIEGVSGTASDNADNDVTVTGSDKQTYQSDVSDISGYTNFSGGNFTVSAKQATSGAVNFQLPAGVSVSSVHWTVQNISPEVTWSIPGRNT